MRPEVFQWIAGASAIALLAWGIRITVTINSTHRKASKLLIMHENPDSYGFGSDRSNSLMKENTRALNQLIHFTKWAVEEQTGKKPPPYIEGKNT